MGMEDFSRNRFVGWASLAVGVAVGLVMGLWSFDGPLRPPAWIGDYADTSRRLVRLGHIAFIGLGLIDILIERELARSALAPAARVVASWAMVMGNVLLPITLFAAAAYHPVKYLMAVPATSVFLALGMVAYGCLTPNAPILRPQASSPTPHASSLKPQATEDLQ
jgi:uncharacterized membrane protein YiaA